MSSNSTLTLTKLHDCTNDQIAKEVRFSGPSIRSSPGSSRAVILGLEAEMGKDLDALVREFADGRTDLVFELIAAGVAPDKLDGGGVSL